MQISAILPKPLKKNDPTDPSDYPSNGVRTTSTANFYAMAPETREVRAANARVHINTRFSAKQQVFVDFVLSHYVSVGVEELEQEKLSPLLHLKYHNSIADAVADLGRPDEIGRVFAGFQKYLYQQVA